MHPHEAATVAAFIAPSRRPRWLAGLASAKRRGHLLGALNHCRDLDERYARPLSPGADATDVLRALGAPADCRVLSDLADLDGRELPLAEAVARAEAGGFGTLICCVPGVLAYYLDERGTRRRLILERAGTPRELDGTSFRSDGGQPGPPSASPD